MLLFCHFVVKTYSQGNIDFYTHTKKGKKKGKRKKKREN